MPGKTERDVEDKLLTLREIGRPHYPLRAI